jgi:hypothetical protein
MEGKVAKILKLALLVTGTLALFVWVMPDWIILGFFLLILPGVVLSLMPSVFLYLSTFSAIWFFTRKRGEMQAVGFGLAGLLTLAVGLPIVLNRKSEALLAEANERELAPREKVSGRGRVISIELPASTGTATCSELCQVLLFNGEAEQVVVRTNGEKSHQKSVRGFRLENGDCQIDLTGVKKMLEVSYWTWSKGKQAEAVAHAVRSRIAGGECLVSANAAAGEGMEIRWVNENPNPTSRPLQLRALPSWNRGVEIRVNGKVVARETLRQASWYSQILLLEPIPSGMGFSGWRWARKTERVEESEIDRMAMLRRLTDFDLDSPRGLGSVTLRERLDKALADPDGSNAAFVLLTEYYEDLRQEDFDSGDRQRLTRLILDDRVRDFSYFDWSRKQRENVGPRIRDAILKRLLRLSADLDNKDQAAVYFHLESIAGKLGRNTYAGDVPLLDELLADAKVRETAFNLVPRLADQGRAGAEKLVEILEAPGEMRDRTVEAVLSGLCLCAGDAREFLPRLRRIHSSKPEDSFTRGHAWRGMLIAFGADAAEFRSRNHPDTARYAEDLRRAAKGCLTRKPDY